MRPISDNLGAALLAGAVLLFASTAWSAERRPQKTLDKPVDVLVDDFERDELGWSLKPFHATPRAAGHLAVDEGVCKSGARSMRLVVDFSGGGVGVSATHDLGKLQLRNMSEVRFQVRSENVSAVGVRLLNAAGKRYDTAKVTLRGGADWQAVVLSAGRPGRGAPAGGEDEGAWRGAVRLVALRVERDDLVDPQAPGALWIDDVQVRAVTEGVRFEQTIIGNVFLETEDAAIKLVAPRLAAGAVEWTVRDVWGRTVDEGAVKRGGTHLLPLRPPRLGYYTVRADIRRDGRIVDTTRTSLAILGREDVRGRQDARFGLATHLGQGWVPHETVQLLARACVQQVRDEFFWGWVERTKGEFRFPVQHKGFLPRLKANGIKYIACLTYGNEHYDGGNAPYTAEGFAAYARYAAFAAESLGEHLAAIEIWNEYNDAHFCKGPAASKPAVYLQMLKAAYTSIKAVRPDIPVLGCATTGPWWGGKKWLLEFFALEGSMEYMDYLSIHAYDCVKRNGNYLEDCREQMQGYMGVSPADALPVIVTEWGWPVGDKHKVTEREQAYFAVQSYVCLAASGVERSFWYDFVNDGIDPADGEHNFGIVRHMTDPMGYCTPKPAYVAFAAMTRRLVGATYVKRETMSGGMCCYLFEKDGKPVRVAWTLSPGAAVRLAAGGPVKVTDFVGHSQVVRAPLGQLVLRVPLGEPVYLEPAPARRVKAAPKSAAPRTPVAKKRGLDPDLVAFWDYALATRLEEELAAGRTPTFFMGSTRKRTTVTGARDQSELAITVGRGPGAMRMKILVSKLSFADKQDLASKILRRDRSADHCLAAFFALAAGDERAAERLLREVDAADAESVLSAFPR